jgi:S-layer protein (TIGR01567 family)
MKIRKIMLVAALAVLSFLLVHTLAAFAQEPVEAAYVRGHFSEGNGVWRADDFGWFYYDLDKAHGGEQLLIDMQGRVADKGHIVYSSEAWSKQFEYEPWGSFRVVAFLGKLYLAGYQDSSFTDDVSSLEKGDLRAVLLDEEQTYTLTANTSLPLGEGYVLKALEVSEKKGAVNFELEKNGDPVYAAAVSIGDTFVYKVNDIPVLLVHLANAMRGGDLGFAEVDAVFQVSDEPSVKLFEGGRLGNMELIDLSEDSIKFQNDRSLTFSRNQVVPLTDDLVIVVLDQPELIYYPSGGFYDYGIHEVRGPTFNASTHIPVLLGNYNSSVIAKWNSENYSGFYLDPEKRLGVEALVLYRIHGKTVLPPTNPVVYKENNTVVQEGFQYTSLIQPKEFEFKPWGNYFVISFLGDQWFAGYDSSLTGQKSSKSLLEHEYLGRILMDIEPRGKILAGNYSLAEDYEMRIRDVGNDTIFLQLLKEGVLVDSSVVKSNSTYIYKKDLGDVNDMPIIMVHLSNVFNNGMESFATIDGIFQISDQYILPVEPGRGMGEMEIVYVQPNVIVMVNHDYINLNRDSTISIGPGMSIRVADNDTLRYYLYNSQYVVPAPKSPLVRTPTNATSSTAANFSMIVPAAEIRQVMVSILDSNNRTVFSKDITSQGQGAGDLWRFSWRWNATTLQLSDDKSPVMDAVENRVPALLYLSPSTSPIQVSVVFDPSGRIGGIMDSKSVFYISRNEYKKLNVVMDYDAMLSNDTARSQFLQIEPGKSILQFQDFVNGKLVSSGTNHTLQGTIVDLEPHTIVVGAKPGRYELRVRVENAVNAIQAASGDFFNVTPAEVRGVSLGSAQALAKETISIPLEAPIYGGEKRIDISYDSNIVNAISISGTCNPTWKNDQKAGNASVLLPIGCGAANLTFVAKKANATTYLNVTGTGGFIPETIVNGSITVLGSDTRAKKSNAPGFILCLFAVYLGAYARRKL